MTGAQPQRSGTHVGLSAVDSATGPAGDEQASGRRPDPEGWPRGISRHATMRISDVLAALRIEFPAVTNSKLRFLEEQGLVEPVRTPSGYRQYSPADIERLRYVLRQQRDRYLPLRVIGEQLDSLDAGADEGTSPRAQLATDDGVELRPAPASRFTVATLAHEASVPVSLVEELVAAGVLRPGPSGHFDLWARDVVMLASSLGEHGIAARHLRTFRAAAERQVDLVEQAVAPWKGQKSASSRAHAGTVAAELGELCARLHTILVRAGVADLAP